MKILEVTTKESYTYEGSKSTIEWFLSYYRLLRLSRFNVSMSHFYEELPPKTRNQITRKKQKSSFLAGIRLNRIIVDEII